MYMLDTNICIFAMKKQPKELVAKLVSQPAGILCISSVTYGELCCGVEKSQAKAKNRLALQLLLAPFIIAEFDSKAAEEYGKLRAYLEKQGTPIGPLDTQIAAHAKSLSMTIVTNNTREFLRVPGIRIEDWTTLSAFD